MHPMIRIICLLLMASFVASGIPAYVIVSLSLLIIVYVAARLSVRICWAQVKRMRWFFLSILVVYFWFTPGQAFSPELANVLWVPSVEGVEQGLFRLLCLVLIIAVVSAVLQSTSREQLVSAIFSLLWWTKYIGLSPERLAVRMTLTLEYLLSVQAVIAEAKQNLEPASDLRSRVTNLANTTTGVFISVHQRAEQDELTEVCIDKAEPVMFLHWLYPIVLIALYFSVETIFPFLG